MMDPVYRFKLLGCKGQPLRPWDGYIYRIDGYVNMYGYKSVKDDVAGIPSPDVIEVYEVEPDTPIRVIGTVGAYTAGVAFFDNAALDGKAVKMYAVNDNIPEFGDPDEPIEVDEPIQAPTRYMAVSVNRFGEAPTLKVYAPVRAVRVIYKDDMSVDYTQETGQQFYRKSLSGKITCLGVDYDFIMAQPFDFRYYMSVEMSRDSGRTWKRYFVATFMRTDCTVDVDDKSVTFTMDIIDDYNAIMAGMEKEFDIVELAPAMDSVRLDKRPCFQVYTPGDSIVSCFLGNVYWEQDCEPVSDTDLLQRKYYFGKLKDYQQVMFGDRVFEANGELKNGMELDGANNEKLVYFEMKEQISTPPWPHFKLSNGFIYKRNDKEVGRFTQSVNRQSGDPDVNKFLDIPPNFDISGSMESWPATYTRLYIYGRYVCDVNPWCDGDTCKPTYAIPSDDFVWDNRNYKRCLLYDFGSDEYSISISANMSDKPTKWGKAPNGKYYLPPTSLARKKFMPIARSRWSATSIWYECTNTGILLEEEGRKEYTLRDAYPVSSVLSVLLAKVAPNVTHADAPEYSEAFYGNPLGGKDGWRLYITPKSNITSGEYTQAAQKGKITLKMILDMFKNIFQAYWYIDNGRLRIEKIEYFRNGMGDTPLVGYDLTRMLYTRNNKRWSFGLSEYTFDKAEMPEMYQFRWMDDVTSYFAGEPIEVLSNYVQQGKIEEINVSNITTDIDYMLLAPGEISKDGFALFAIELIEGKLKIPYFPKSNQQIEIQYQNGILSFTKLLEWYWTYDMPGKRLVINGSPRYAESVKRTKKQKVRFPVGGTEPNPLRLVRTEVGDGRIEKISVNLSSRMAKATLRYDTDQ